MTDHVVRGLTHTSAAPLLRSAPASVSVVQGLPAVLAPPF
jgi:hypothetical protein